MDNTYLLHQVQKTILYDLTITVQFGCDRNRFGKRFRPTLNQLVVGKVNKVFLQFESLLLISFFKELYDSYFNLYHCCCTIHTA